MAGRINADHIQFFIHGRKCSLHPFDSSIPWLFQRREVQPHAGERRDTLRLDGELAVNDFRRELNRKDQEVRRADVFLFLTTPLANKTPNRDARISTAIKTCPLSAPGLHNVRPII